MLPIPTKESSSRLADWVELYLLTGHRTISKAALQQQVQIALGNVQERTIDETLLELERRAALYGPKALFSVNSNVVKLTKTRIDWRNHPEYMMCLIYSMLGVISSNDPGTKLFERLAAVALGQYLNGSTIVLGHPSGVGFAGQLVSLANQCNESIGFAPYPAAKDEGVDVVGWKPFGDGRSSQAIVLLQCAAGKNGHTKAAIRQDLWRELIRWGNRTIPGVAIPQAVKAGDWVRKTSYYDLVFDRPRIINLIASVKGHDAGLRADIVQWCENQLA